jgi:hypothetical protein
MGSKTTRVFTLRLRNPETYRMLKLAAEHRNVSMNDIAQEALEEHLRVEAATLADQLEQALEIIQQYADQDSRRDIAAFARAEVTETDPLRSTKITPDDDPFGVRDAFVRSLE